MSNKIYSKLDKILIDLKNAGYVPDVTEVFVQVTEEEKQKVLYWHNEKLAVAFALLSSESRKKLHPVVSARELYTFIKSTELATSSLLLLAH